LPKSPAAATRSIPNTASEAISGTRRRNHAIEGPIAPKLPCTKRSSIAWVANIGSPRTQSLATPSSGPGKGGGSSDPAAIADGRTNSPRARITSVPAPSRTNASSRVTRRPGLTVSIDTDIGPAITGRTSS
jgi:hypothetical protein